LQDFRTVRAKAELLYSFPQSDLLSQTPKFLESIIYVSESTASRDTALTSHQLYEGKEQQKLP